MYTKKPGIVQKEVWGCTESDTILSSWRSADTTLIKHGALNHHFAITTTVDKSQIPDPSLKYSCLSELSSISLFIKEDPGRGWMLFKLQLLKFSNSFLICKLELFQIRWELVMKSSDARLHTFIILSLMTISSEVSWLISHVKARYKSLVSSDLMTAKLQATIVTIVQFLKLLLHPYHLRGRFATILLITV